MWVVAGLLCDSCRRCQPPIPQQLFNVLLRGDVRGKPRWAEWRCLLPQLSLWLLPWPFQLPLWLLALLPQLPHLSLLLQLSMWLLSLPSQLSHLPLWLLLLQFLHHVHILAVDKGVAQVHQLILPRGCQALNVTHLTQQLPQVQPRKLAAAGHAGGQGHR